MENYLRRGVRGARYRVGKRLDRAAVSRAHDVLYLSESAGKNETLLREARATALTVSDAADFTARGGVIRLFTEKNRLRFVINLDNAHRAGLRISSNLLRLASSVELSGAP